MVIYSLVRKDVHPETSLNNCTTNLWSNIYKLHKASEDYCSCLQLHHTHVWHLSKLFLKVVCLNWFLNSFIISLKVYTAHWMQNLSPADYRYCYIHQFSSCCSTTAALCLSFSVHIPPHQTADAAANAKITGVVTRHPFDLQLPSVTNAATRWKTGGANHLLTCFSASPSKNITVEHVCSTPKAIDASALTR